MPIKHYFGDDDIVRYVVISGDFSRADLVNYRRESSESNSDKHRLSFIDLSDLESFSIGIEDTQLHADKVSAKNGSDFIEIFFAPTKLGYGLARMYAASANGRFVVDIYDIKEEATARLNRCIDGRTASSEGIVDSH